MGVGNSQVLAYLMPAQDTMQDGIVFWRKEGRPIITKLINSVSDKEND